MRGKTAKLLRKASALKNKDYRKAKLKWKKLSHLERGKVSKAFREVIRYVNLSGEELPST